MCKFGSLVFCLFGFGFSARSQCLSLTFGFCPLFCQQLCRFAFFLLSARKFCLGLGNFHIVLLYRTVSAAFRTVLGNCHIILRCGTAFAALRLGLGCLTAFLFPGLLFCRQLCRFTPCFCLLTLHLLRFCLLAEGFFGLICLRAGRCDDDILRLGNLCTVRLCCLLCLRSRVCGRRRAGLTGRRFPA